MDSIKLKQKPRHDYGGQHVGMSVPILTLTSEMIGVEITVSEFRSQTENRKLAFTLFELAVDEIIQTTK